MKRILGLDYSVTEDGKVFSHKCNRFLKLGHSGNGYAKVMLHIDGKPLCRKVHNLVAQAYIGERPKGMQVNHKDGNKLNNNFSNLEYVTPSENLRHAVRMGLRKSSIRLDKKNRFNEIKAATKIFSVGAVASRFGMSMAEVKSILNSKSFK
jgi:hypothetical protein